VNTSAPLAGGAIMQFSIRTMLLVVTALAIVLASVGTPMMAVLAFAAIECVLWMIGYKLALLTYELGNRGRPYSGFLVLVTAIVPLAAAGLLGLYAVVVLIAFVARRLSAV
jgi:hypothetical protein